MRIFGRIDPLNLNRRRWELALLALTVILILVAGMALLMLLTVLSNDLIVSGTTKRMIFFGFCALSVLLVGYLLERRVATSQLRKRLAEEHQRGEEALRESEAGFRAIFENAAIGIALLDLHGHPVESNPALQKMLGYAKLELADMAFTEYTHPDDVRADWDLFTELAEGKRDQYQIEKRLFRKDGQVVWGSGTKRADSNTASVWWRTYPSASGRGKPCGSCPAASFACRTRKGGASLANYTTPPRKAWRPWR